MRGEKNWKLLFPRSHRPASESAMTAVELETNRKGRARMPRIVFTAIAMVALTIAAQAARSADEPVASVPQLDPRSDPQYLSAPHSNRELTIANAGRVDPGGFDPGAARSGAASARPELARPSIGYRNGSRSQISLGPADPDSAGQILASRQRVQKTGATCVARQHRQCCAEQSGDSPRPVLSGRLALAACHAEEFGVASDGGA